MSIQAVAWALEQDLPARPKLVLVAIANHANHIDGYCWLKAETIAREAACTPRSIYNFVGALIRNGFIRKSLRRGEDGKQRATDYWILFDREERPWAQDAHLESNEADPDPSEIDTEEDLGTTSGEPPESGATGETETPPPRQPVDIPAGSCGPSESGFHHKRIAEPSKINPKASTPPPHGATVRPRGYTPPPLQPIGADLGHPTKPIFVYEGSRAYEAWSVVKSRERGFGLDAKGRGTWRCSTRAFINGEWRSGWYFPTLFPPGSESGTSDEGRPATTGPPPPS